MEMHERVRDNRLRRMAERQRLRVTKSKRRDPMAWDYGLYWLVDANGRRVTADDGMDAEAVEAWLRGDRPSASVKTNRSTRRS